MQVEMLKPNCCRHPLCECMYLRHACGRRLRLQKRLAHALLQRGDRGVHRVQVLLRIAGLLDEVRVLLLPDVRRLLEVRLGGFAVLGLLPLNP